MLSALSHLLPYMDSLMENIHPKRILAVDVHRRCHALCKGVINVLEASQ